VVAAVAVTVIVLTRGGDDSIVSALSEIPSSPGLATTAPPATSGGPASTSARATTAPPTTSAPPRPIQPAPGNLLANGDFERDLAGWRSITGGRVDRVAIGHSGRWSLRLQGGGTPSPSGGGPDDPAVRATQTVEGRTGDSYEASAWVRATRPGTEAILKLRQLGGEGDSADVIGVILVDTGWHQVAVIHQIHAGGGRLTVEAAAGNLGPGDGLLLDQISLIADHAG
jgi:Carbohydrate binding domain